MYQISQGDCLDKLDELEENSIDCIITDPPYGLTSITKRFGKEGSAPAQYGKDGAYARLSKGFMGKEWDGSGIEYNVEMWAKCLRVLKPGGYLLSFGGTRTYHRIASAIEEAGFEIRDCIMWLYGSGFPKSMNISKGIEAKEKYGKANTVVKRLIEQSCDGEEFKVKQTNNGAMGKIVETTRKHYTPKAELSSQWQGWGTCLKPAYEPIIVARKPFKGPLIDNVLKNRVGALNIGECRVPITDENNAKEYHFNNNGNMRSTKADGENLGAYEGRGKVQKEEHENPTGRYPANLILSYNENDKEEVCGGFPQSKGGSGKGFKKDNYELKGEATNFARGDFVPYNDNGSAARYFKNCPYGIEDSEDYKRYYYSAKASSADRNEGLLGKELDSIMVVLKSSGDKEIWSDQYTINAGNEVRHREAMAQSLKKAIEEYGIREQKNIDLSILWYGKKCLEKYLAESKSTTETGISSTTASQILSLLTRLNISESTQNACSKTESGGNLVEIVGSSNLLQVIIKENPELVHGVNNVALKILLKIKEKESRCDHPTVKPTSLMRYLVRLVAPNGATILDPFMGSGSTGKAVMLENKENGKDYKFIGIEKDEHYCELAKKRIKYVIER